MSDNCPLLIITCLCYTTAVPVSCGLQRKAREISWTQSVGVCVFVILVNEGVAERKIIFITY